MDPAVIAAVKEKLSAFDIHTATYQQVDAHAITADILVPKAIRPGRRPVIVSFHGGYLITGTSLFPGYFLPWILDLALEHSAVLVRPNYRKLPESTGREILEGLARFWTWFRGGLGAAVEAATAGAVEADEARTLLIGHSAGAYLAVQSAITQPEGTFRAIIAGYGMLDMKSPWFTTHFEKHPLGRPMLPPSVVDDHLASMKPGQTVSAVTPPLRLDLALATLQYGRYPEMLGSDKAAYPMEMLDTVTSFPPLFIYHGEDDSAVEVRQTEAFVETFGRLVPRGKLLVRYERGDHGFDAPVGLGAPWLREGLDFLQGEWLG
ncbi:MAG: hypothetical protein ALECFALPRED_007428 [Alectoria fallacina]|uniref:Alpha/beta hydrolase fold-3 domain-containing protein n=1 Tax=Alectoria fallacina TaxID=1903189 RepID=A0A8H3IRQ1_9LECA|nr:MAG: hypothetical protein ALECFALPRED_007428 [Alectoria fallacina]